MEIVADIMRSIHGILPTRRRFAQLLTTVAWCFCSTSCSKVGILVPIPMEGAEIVSTVCTNDTLRIRDDQVILQAYGTWTEVNMRTDVWVEIENASDRAVSLDVSSVRMIGDNNEQALLSAVHKVEGDVIRVHAMEKAIIEARKRGMFEMVFVFGAKTTAKLPAGTVTKTIELTLPVQMQGRSLGKNVGFRFTYAKWPLPWQRKCRDGRFRK